jgi:hypothetical protein
MGRVESLKSIGLIVFGVLSVATANANNKVSCSVVVSSALFNPKPPDLNAHYRQDVASKTAEQVASENQRTLSELTAYIPKQSASRSQAVPIRWAKELLSVAYNHSVVGWNARERYKRDGVEIGFCFGRAMFMHLMFLKMGVQKDSIKKIWAVGPMQTSDGITWGHHVATIVFSREQGWVVVDTNHANPLPVKDWMAHYKAQNSDGKLKFYITEPEKFGIETVKYTRVNLGLGMNRESDWYQHYFVDMLKAVSTSSVESMGLPKLVPAENKVSVGSTGGLAKRMTPIARHLRDNFWIFN